MKIAVHSFNGVTSDASDWHQISEFAREAEALGADSIWTSEAWGTDAITPLAYLAASTTKIRLGTGIVQVVCVPQEMDKESSKQNQKQRIRKE